MWRSIWATKNLICKHNRVRVGDGTRTLVTQEPWLPDTESGLISTRLGEEFEKAKVNDLMIPEQLQWDQGLIRDLFSSRDSELILTMPLSFRRIEDMWYWLHDDKKHYTVKSGYRTLQERYPHPATHLWTNMWKLLLVRKIVFLL